MMKYEGKYSKNNMNKQRSIKAMKTSNGSE